MSRILVESANLLYSVMMQLKEKTNKDVEKIVDSLEGFFHSSLLKAVEDMGETAALRVLVQLKLDPNVEYHSTHVKADTKATPLYIACQLGHTEAVRVLLLNQANPSIPSSDNKKTPLMVACSNKHAEVVKLLLAHRATDVDALDEDHDTALRYANDQNCTEIVRLLLESAHANPNVYGKNDWSCLLVSCCEGYLDNVVLLLEHGADPYHKVKGGKTCLMMASQYGHIDIVHLLLNSKRVDAKRLINVQTEEGWSALALSYDRPKIVELLLEHGADPNLHTNDGWTPLILACQKEGILTTVELLLNPKHQVDIEHENDYGVSAYGLASWNKLKDIMELLDKAGAKQRLMLVDMAKSLIRLKPVMSMMKKFGSKTESSPVTSEEPHVGGTMPSLPKIAGTAIVADGAGEEAQQSEQEQGQADKVLKAHREQLQLVKEIKEIEREMESLGNTSAFELSSTPEARDKLGKIQEKIRYVKEVVLSEGVGTEEGGSIGSLTAAEVIDAYDVSLGAIKTKLEAAQHEAANSKQECAEKDNKIIEMEKKMAVLQDNNEQQADKITTLQRKVADAKLAVEVEVQVDTLSDVVQEYKERLQASEQEEQRLLKASELKQKMVRARDAQISNLKTSNKVLQEKCDKLRLIADDDDKQQLLNYMIRVCRPKDWQISLLEDRLTERQLAISSSHSQKRLDNVLKAVKSWPTVSTSDTVVQADYLAIAPDYLRGVEVYGETVLEVVGGKAQKLEWPGHGFYIEVPQGALAPGVTASVGVKVILAGQFKLPEKCQLISAIYWIHTSEVFLEEVAVNIRHYADLKSEEQCSKCRFIIAKCSQKELPYTFKEKEGFFNPYTQYGTIKVKQFSLVGETAPIDQELHYIGYMLYKPFESHTADFHFVVVLDDNLHLSEMKKHYQEWYKDATAIYIKFQSSCDVVQLKPQKHETWKITPVTSPSEISKSAVRHFQPGKTTWIPNCVFEIQPLSGDPGRLFCTVDLTGVESPKSFCIRYPQPVDHKLPIQTPPSTRSSSIVSAASMGRSDSTSSTQNPLSPPLPIFPTSDENVFEGTNMSASSSSTAETTAKERSEATASRHSSHQPQAPTSTTCTNESSKGAHEQSELVQEPSTATHVHMASPTSLPFTSTHPLDTKPKIATLLNCFKYKGTKGEIQRYYIVDKIAAKWRKIGLALEFETNSLDSIETTCNHDVVECCEKMLTKWLGGYVKQLPITWRILLEALRDANMNQLADELIDLLDKHLHLN